MELPWTPLPAPPLPLEDVRDLLGIVRALWRAGFAGDATPERLAELEEIGRMLKLALKLAQAGPDTLGGRAASSWAEQATARLGKLIGETEPIAPVIQAAARRVKRSRPT